MQITYEKLEALYAKYNKFYYIHPDPLEFVYHYQYDHDREIVGLLSSSLAYGNVKQILKSVSIVLGKMGESPRNYILTNHEEVFFKDFEGFKHRFTTCEDFVKLLMGIKSVLKKHDSLQKCFVNCLSASNNVLTSNFIKTVSLFAKRLNAYYKDNRSYLIPSPQNGSACKRLMLYLRWMIRKDKVDPGCWNDEILSSNLIIPLDTHMYQISKAFGYTERKSADLKTAIEITEKFAAINSVDPVKYDFVLTRFGIRDELNYNDIYSPHSILQIFKEHEKKKIFSFFQ